MRLHLRPEFLVHKFFNHLGVSLSVWRDNRAASEAFRDPSLLNRVHGPGKEHAGKAQFLRLAGLIAFLALASAAFHFRNHEDREGPLASLPPQPPTSVSMAVPPIPLASPKTAEVTEPARYPTDASVLIACKRDRTLYVYRCESSKWVRTAAFPMAIGRNAGNKGEDGDLRTPEGRFWITGLLPGPAKGPMYGPLIYTLNYPRPGDMAEGKTGKGIWIHGVEAGSQPTFTHGCLSLANDDVLALSAYADIATPVVILSDNLGPDPASQVDLSGMAAEYPSILAAFGRKGGAEAAAKEKILAQARNFVAKEAKDYPDLAMQSIPEADKKAVLARLDQWRADWSSRSIESYASNYDPAFRDRQGHDKQAFIERKRKIFASKSRIEMEIREPRIESEGYSRVKVTFRQDYLAEGPQGQQRSSEPKSLRLDQGPAGWLIITE